MPNTGSNHSGVPKPPRKKLSQRFLSSLLFIVFVGQCISLVFSYLDTHRVMTSDLHEKILLSGKQLASVAVISRRDFDFTYLGQLVDELAKDSDITRITYLDGELTIIDRHEVARTPKAELAATIEIPVLAGADKVGKVLVEYSEARIHAIIRHQTMIGALLQSAIFAVIALFVYFFFNRHIGSRVTEIRGGIAAAGSGDLTVRLHDLRDNDEFSDISEGFALLVQWLSSTVARIKGITRNATDATAYLNKTFKDVIGGVNRQQLSTDNALISLQDAIDSLQQVTCHTDALLELSDNSMASLASIRKSSIGVLEKMDRLGNHVNASHETVRLLSHSSREVSGMALRASDSMSDAVTAVSRINESVGKIQGIVRETTDLSASTTEIIADRGINSVADAIATMQKIDEHVVSLSTTISSLGTRSKDIAKVLDVIKEVTEQTKLLSLNAQILSGQAGESGKPFAVVASEMKTLSDKTAVSTREIEAIVYALRHEIGTAVTSTTATSEMVKEGKAVAQRAGDALTTIQNSSQKSTGMVRTIETVALEQNRNLMQVADAFGEIQKLIMEVNRATTQEEEGIGLLYQSFGTIRSAVDETRNAYTGQAASIEAIAGNLSFADEKTRQIAESARRQQEMSEELVVAMKRLIQIGAESLKGVRDVSERIVSISKELESLDAEMKTFKTQVIRPMKK